MSRKSQNMHDPNSNPVPNARGSLFVLGVAAIVGISLTGIARASDDKEDPYAAFAQTAKSYQVFRKDESKPLPLRKEPILKWTNPIRRQERGSVFVWTENDRPIAVGSFFTYVYDSKVFPKHEFHSLATTPLKAAIDGTDVWTPSKGVEWKPFKDVRPPAAQPRLRLVQMRQLARRFELRLHDPNRGKQDLRLVPQPLLRYEPESETVVDGAIFSFAVATDPEAMLLIEARKPKDGLQWRYAFARFHYWALDARLDGKQVWAPEEDILMETLKRGAADGRDRAYISFSPPAE